MYELLSPERRVYNKREQAIHIVNALKNDDRFAPGITYVEATLLAHQRESNSNNRTVFPLDLEIDEIGVTIDERCNEYTVGDQTISVPTVSTATVNAMKGRNRNVTKEKKNNGLICKACYGLNHCVTNKDDICYNLAKIHLCCNFIKDERNMKDVKANAYKYRKERKEKSQQLKITDKLDSVIRKLTPSDGTANDMIPLVNLTKALCEDNDTYSTSSDMENSLNSE